MQPKNCKSDRVVDKPKSGMRRRATGDVPLRAAIEAAGDPAGPGPQLQDVMFTASSNHSPLSVKGQEIEFAATTKTSITTGAAIETNDRPSDYARFVGCQVEGKIRHIGGLGWPEK